MYRRFNFFKYISWTIYMYACKKCIELMYYYNKKSKLFLAFLNPFHDIDQHFQIININIKYV